MATRAGDRQLVGRLAFLGDRQLAVPLGVVLSVLMVAGSRLPLRTHYLLNWDAAQFALGMQRFDIVHHQPHPPGYVGYLALGRLFALVFPDPNAALVALSIVGECAGVAVAFLFA